MSDLDIVPRVRAASSHGDNVIFGRRQSARRARTMVHQTHRIQANATHPSGALADLGDREGLDGPVRPYLLVTPPVLRSLRGAGGTEAYQAIPEGLTGTFLVLGDALATVGQI